jgi:DNA-binding transcriptional MerR regulator
MEPLADGDQVLIQDVLNQPWLSDTLEQQALSYAAEKLVPEHFQEIKEQRERQVKKILDAVHERLTKEIDHWQDRYFHLKEAMEAGKQPRMQPENARRRAEELRARLEQRTKELMAKRSVVSSSPVVVGAALVIPAGLLARRKGQEEALFSQDVHRRQRIEQIAMHTVMAHEQTQGYKVKDVSAEKCGWDVSAYKEGHPDRHIEVKGRAKGQSTLTITRNEIMYALNQEDKFWLAVVFVDEENNADGPYYVQKPFKVEPEWGVASLNYDVQELLG